MMQQAIDRSTQTGGSFATSVVVHILVLLLVIFLAGREVADRFSGDELTEIAYIEARYGEDVAEKVKLKELPGRKNAPGPPGPGITTDSAMKKNEPALAEQVAPEPLTAPEPTLVAEPKRLAPAKKMEPVRAEPQRPVLAAAKVPEVAPVNTAPQKELAQASRLEASAAPLPRHQVIDTDKLEDSLAGKLSENKDIKPRAAKPRTKETFKPTSGGLKDRGGRAAVGSDPVVAAASSSRKGGAVAEAPATVGGGNLSSRTPGSGSYAAPKSSLAPANTARGGMGGASGIVDAVGPTGGGGSTKGARKTILDYGSGGGGGGGLKGRRARLAEPPTSKNIVAGASDSHQAEPQPKVAEAKVPSTKGVGMTISGQIAGRKIIHSVPPKYSEQAKRKGWEGAVAVHFTVLPDGRVKDNVYFDQTSVHRDLNKAAMAAIRQFKFAPLPASAGAIEQWGVITIVFRLN